MSTCIDDNSAEDAGSFRHLSPVPATASEAFERWLGEQLAREARALSTRDKYDRAWKRFVEWCDSQGLPALPASPTTVRRYIVLRFYGLLGLDLDRCDAGELSPAIKSQSVVSDVAAINLEHERARLPVPGLDIEVTEVIRGMRTLSPLRADEPKEPLVYERLVQVHAAANMGRVTQCRTALIRALLCCLPDATPGQIARLRLQDLHASASTLTVTLSATRRHGPLTTTCIRLDRGQGRALSQALERWYAALPAQFADRPLLCHLDGRPLTAEAIRRTPRALGAIDSGLDNLALRDSALLLVGYFTGMRADNLVRLRWSDADDKGDHIALLLRDSKSDQQGVGHWVAVHESAPGVLCGASALRAWRRQHAALLGVAEWALPDDAPVFPSLTRHGTLSHRRRMRSSQHGRNDPTGFLSTDDVTDLVQRYADLAGLDERLRGRRKHPYGAHSLRAGFVTDAIRQGVSAVEIALTTAHKDPRQIALYNRHVGRMLNPAGRKLLEGLAQQHADVPCARESWIPTVSLTPASAPQTDSETSIDSGRRRRR